MGSLSAPTVGFAGPTSQIFTTPYPHQPGDKARDKDGNEFLFCNFTGAGFFGVVMQIDSNFNATPLLGTARVAIRVGVCMSGDGTSNNSAVSGSINAGWVQIYGLHQAVQTGSATDGLTSDNTVAYVCIPQTSVGTPSGTFTVITPVAGTSIAQTSTDTPRIYGMWVVPRAEVSALTTDISGWTSGTSGPVSEAVGPYALAAGTATSGASDTLLTTGATSGYIGQQHVVFLNYPYVTGIDDAVGTGTT